MTYPTAVYRLKLTEKSVMNRLVTSISLPWAWKAKIADAFISSQKTAREPSSENLVVRVDQRTPSPTGACPVAVAVWPSDIRTDVTVCGERFGISHEELTAIGDNMNTALQKFENISQSQGRSESFDKFMSEVEERICLLYEKYDGLISNASFDDDGKLQLGEVEMQVFHFSVAVFFIAEIVTARPLKDVAFQSRKE